MTSDSADGGGYDDIVALSQQLFGFLCSSSGHVEFDVPHTETVALWSQTPSRTLAVQHQVPCKSRGGDDIWSIDGETCKLSPPRLLFERMPTKVAAVHATKQLPDVHYPGYTARILMDAVEAFAYDNMDMLAWKMRSTANLLIKLQDEGWIHPDVDVMDVLI